MPLTTEQKAEIEAQRADATTTRRPTVAALEKIRNPAQVALEVLRRTDHVLLVGAGALPNDGKVIDDLRTYE